MRREVKNFILQHTVPIVAFVAALITCFFVPPDARYAEYFDWRTLSCLFCTLAVVGALKNIRFFEWLSARILKRFSSLRQCVFALVFITFFGSMILANDMALITFLPLGYFILTKSGRQKYMAITFILQNIAANLGGMLTPFGNPQNLYLYSYFSIPTAEFFAIMSPLFLGAVVLLFSICFTVKPLPVRSDTDEIPTPSLWRTVVYALLFLVSVLTVFRFFPYYVGLAVVLVGILAVDRKALIHVDYGLLLTFAAFFVFSGNLSRIPAFADFLGSLMQRYPLLVGELSCQVISNVPTAILLSKFTQRYPALLVAVNLGGLGTPVASLASLITLSRYTESRAGKVRIYLGLFLLVNFACLLLLTLLATLYI